MRFAKKPVPQKACKAITATKKPKNTASLLSKHISLPLLIRIKIKFAILHGLVAHKADWQ